MRLSSFAANNQSVVLELRLEACRPLCHFRPALAIEVNFADSFDPREDVINGLAPHSHELASHDPRYEIARQLQNFLRRPAIETFAQDCCHRASERLHL